jgi:bifunctional non-homologous end joining protein LigD
MMQRLTPMRLLRFPKPFDRDDDFIFEPKIDGFRALAQIERGRCTLISRNGHTFKSWPQLQEEIVRSVQGEKAVVDGEIACLEADGRPNSASSCSAAIARTSSASTSWPARERTSPRCR